MMMTRQNKFKCISKIKMIITFLIFIFSTTQQQQAWALDVYGVYLGSCEREIGTIVKVRDQSFDILSIEGLIKTIPRYQAIYLATYPLDVLPNSKFEVSKGSEIYSISTRVGSKVKPFIKGWAVNFTTDQVSFLSLEGKEALVDKTELWELSKTKLKNNLNKEKKRLSSINFVDPYPFAHCKRKSELSNVIPQKLYADAVDVKREFDRLQLGHQEIDKYIKRQAFYPKPEVYSNSSILGMWLMTGGRYGSSDSRTNNFSPFLTNELSLGPYSYQHLITTGSGPLLDGTHSETQTHFFYKMKAEYVHLSLMADPNLLLVGKQYNWKIGDLDKADFRFNETFFIEFGLDFGAFSVEISPAMSANTAVRIGNDFRRDLDFNLARFGLRYTGIDHSFNFMIGAAKDDYLYQANSVPTKMNFFRFNIERALYKKHKLNASLIYKSVEGALNSNLYDFSSIDVSALYTHEYKERFYFSGLVGLESHSMEIKNAKALSEDGTSFKLGINAALKF